MLQSASKRPARLKHGAQGAHGGELENDHPGLSAHAQHRDEARVLKVAQDGHLLSQHLVRVDVTDRVVDLNRYCLVLVFSTIDRAETAIAQQMFWTAIIKWND